MQERCVIVDGHSLMYRAFHALPLMDADGVYTNAVHGFLSMLLRVFREQRPQYCAVAFDDHTPTFRHEGYEAYKAGRSPMPDELRPQFPLIQELLSAMGIGVVILPRWEADDVLGTISRQANERGIEALLLTGDRDALQLVSDDTKMLFTRKGISETILFDPKGVKEYFGVSPEQVPDWKGLMGDSSDNIPGIPGVGEKTAVKLLDSYGTLEGVLEHADEIKGKLGEKVRDKKEQARMSKRLATIDRDAPLNAAFGEWTITKLQGALPLLKKYQLNVIAAEVMKMSAGADVSTSPKDDASLPPVKEAQHIDEMLAFAKYLGRGSLILCLNEEGLSFSKPDGQAIRLKFQEAQQDLFNTSSAPTMEEALKAIAPLLQKTGLITHDAKRFLHRLPALNLPIPEVIHDTMVLCYLRNPQERGYELSNFAAQDAQGIALLLKDRLEGVRQEGMEALYHDIELPLVRVLFDMEAEGFQVDKEPLIDMGQRFSEQTKQLQEEIYALTGVKGFNINSPQQLGRVLFEDLKLPSGRKTRTGYSTDADTLEGLKALHPAIDKILEYRQIVKLNGTYIEGLLRKVDATGRIHTTFDQVGTATGRISSIEPNLQNIPVRTLMGREIRRAFVAKPGCVLVDGDYSQIELRVLAHMSGDEAMCDAFIRGQDIHTRTAAEINGVPMQQVTGEMRSAAKAVNFGIVYGISDFGLASNIGISIKRAGEFIARYLERYPKVHEFMETAKKEGYLNEYAQTLYGRRRRLPELKSSNANQRNFGERVAMNMPIQGTAADIIKAAMVRVHRRLAEEGLKARLILTVHDELLIEAPEEEAGQVVGLLRESMEGVIKLKVPLQSDIKTGNSWYETK